MNYRLRRGMRGSNASRGAIVPERAWARSATRNARRRDQPGGLARAPACKLFRASGTFERHHSMSRRRFARHEAGATRASSGAGGDTHGVSRRTGANETSNAVPSLAGGRAIPLARAGFVIRTRRHPPPLRLPPRAGRVLRAGAVPKGPSLDPGDKRLAMGGRGPSDRSTADSRDDPQRASTAAARCCCGTGATGCRSAIRGRD